MGTQTTSLFYPESKVKIGAYELTKGVRIDVYSSKDTYYDWAKLKVQQALSDAITISKADEAEIMLGYDGVLNTVFKGYVFKSGSQTSAEREILLKDDMLHLESIDITNTFLNVEPSEIVEYCLSQAGITSYKLFEHKYPKIKVVPINKKNIIQVFEDVKRLWGIIDLFYFANGIFYFGQKHEQDKIYKFEYGNNIISLKQESGSRVLETASAPFIRHSDIIEIEHPKASGRYEVNKIVFSSNDAGFLRTRIYF